MAAPVAALIERGQRDGEIDPALDPMFAAGTVVTLVIGVVGLVERDAIPLADARAQARRFFRNALMGDRIEDRNRPR